MGMGSESDESDEEKENVENSSQDKDKLGTLCLYFVLFIDG